MMHFQNRREAGQKLADALSEYSIMPCVVYALPRGGVELGLTVAKKIKKPLDLLIPRKVSHPSQPEYAICAVTEDGHRFCNEQALVGVDADWLESEIKNQQQEAKRRRKTYLKDRQTFEVEGKTAIIVDDGIATGLTMLAAIAQVRARKPSQIVVAVPVLPKDVADQLQTKADTLVALSVPEVYMGAVGAYYRDFPQVTDEEVLKTLSSV